MIKLANCLVWIGALLLVIGFVYDIVFAGIPFQDAPPGLVNKYELNTEIAQWIMLTGLLLLVAGFLIKITTKLNRGDIHAR